MMFGPSRHSGVSPFAQGSRPRARSLIEAITTRERVGSVSPPFFFSTMSDKLKLRSIGQNDYRVLEVEGEQRIGRIRYADERIPSVWIWNVTLNLPDGMAIGSCKDLDTAKAEFKAAWLALKARTTPEQLAAAYRATNIRDDG